MKVEMIIPNMDNDGSDNAAVIERTVREMCAMFGGVTTYEANGFWVSDTGRGMDEEAQQNAFERFSARPSRSGHRGAGLGLSIVKSFVELHDGKVELQSEIDTGTTVTIQLPRVGPMKNGSVDGAEPQFAESARLSAG